MHGKNTTCCFSGHRDITDCEIKQVEEKLRDIILRLCEEGFTDYIAGGAVGFDMLAAITVLNIKAGQRPDISLTLALPCQRHFDKWKPSDKEMLARLIEKADNVVYVSKNYSPSCMRARNQYMVNNSSACVCYLNRDKGGTASTVRFANKQGLRIINIIGDSILNAE